MHTLTFIVLLWTVPGLPQRAVECVPVQADAPQAPRVYQSTGAGAWEETDSADAVRYCARALGIKVPEVSEGFFSK